MDSHDEFITVVQKDFFWLMCGEQIGSGASRDVYSFAQDLRYVVKIETGSQSFSNVREWDVWNAAKEMGPDTSKWLAPCKAISSCGIVLIQERTKPAKTYPDKIPSWMTDTKRSNFGMTGRRFVAHDYGNHLICNGGMTRRRRKVDWWDV